MISLEQMKDDITKAFITAIGEEMYRVEVTIADDTHLLVFMAHMDQGVPLYGYWMVDAKDLNSVVAYDEVVRTIAETHVKNFAEQMKNIPEAFRE